MAISFTQRTGGSNPFNGVDVGGSSALSLMDIDGDGDLDAFLINGGSQPSGTALGVNVKYYQNTGTAIVPVFAEQTGVSNPFSSHDVIPAAGKYHYLFSVASGDINGDGDVDVIFGGSEDSSGGAVYHIWNNTGGALYPSFSGTSNTTVVSDGYSRLAMSLVDIDADGDLDLFMGNRDGGVSDNAIFFYKNNGTAISASFTHTTGVTNPFNNIGVGTNAYAAPTFLDVDGDGDKDAFIGENDGTINYFENTGTAIAPAFTQRTGASNPFNGVDVGGASTPTVGDADGDGDMDVFIGAQDGTFFYFENTSTNPAFTPAFTEQVGAGNNPFNGVDVGKYATPYFVDINGDGDFDVFIGDFYSNTISYFENTGTAIAPAFTQRTGGSNPLNGFTTDSNQTSVAFVDINSDGDQDAFLADNRGTVRFLENTGTAISPTFVERTGGSNPVNGFFDHYSADKYLSFVDIDGDGDHDLFVSIYSFGVYINEVRYYENTGDAISPAFTLQAGGANPFNGITLPIGPRLPIAFGDIDGDGDQDAFLEKAGGSSDGQIRYFENTGTVSSPSFTERTGASNPLNGVDLQYIGASFFVDIDGDGDLDNLIGAYSANMVSNYSSIRFFENTGTNNLIGGGNAAPTLTGLVASVTYNENTVNATAQVVDTDVTFADADSADLNTGNLTIAYSSGGGAEDQLSIQNQGTGAGQIGFSAGTVTYAGVTIGTVPTSGAGSGINGATLVITFTAAAATPTAVDALIQNLTYQNTSNAPTGARTISITVNDGDGGTSTAATTVINVTAQNDAPVVSGVDATASYTEGGAAQVIDSTITITDADDTNIESATISISANFVTGDRLNFTNQNGISGSYNAGTGVLTLTGSATKANYETALESITFDSTSDSPTNATRTISVVINDGDADSAADTTTLSVTPVNDAPVNTVPGAQNVTLPAALVFSSGNGNLISIADGDNSSHEITLTATNGAITLSGTTGLTFSTGDGTDDTTMTFTGTDTNINTALAGLSFAGTAAGGGSLQIVTDDDTSGATGQTDSDTIAITVAAAAGGGGGGGGGGGSSYSLPPDIPSGTDAPIIDQGSHPVIEITSAPTTPVSGTAGRVNEVRSAFSVTLGDNVQILKLFEVNNVNGTNINGTGNNLDNYIAGNSSTNTLLGSMGQDTIFGLSGDDSILGNQSGDFLTGNKGADYLHGGMGNDEVSGGKGDDQVFGGKGNDTVSGGRGNDTLTGGMGADQFIYTGLGAADPFTVDQGFGNDILTDFNRGEGDKIVIAAGINGSSITSFADMHISDITQGAQIDLGNGNTITVIGINAADLRATDFVFV